MSPGEFDWSGDVIPAEMQHATKDRLLYWPIVTAVACLLALILAWANLFPGSPLLIPVILLLWAAISVRTAIMCVAWFRERAWLRFISAISLPLTALAAALCLVPLWSVGQKAGDYVHLVVSYPRYAAEISALTGDAPRFLVWEWSGTAPCRSGVAYDDSDKLDPSMPPKIWGGRYGVSVAGESRAFGHFYFVDICPLP